MFSKLVVSAVSRPHLPGCYARLRELWALWRLNIHSRKQLAALDSRLLADAGISEAQRQMELAKPFWR